MTRIVAKLKGLHRTSVNYPMRPTIGRRLMACDIPRFWTSKEVQRRNRLRPEPLYKDEEWCAWARLVGITNPGGCCTYSDFEYNAPSAPLGVAGLPDSSMDPRNAPLGTFDQAGGSSSAIPPSHTRVSTPSYILEPPSFGYQSIDLPPFLGIQYVTWDQF